MPSRFARLLFCFVGDGVPDVPSARQRRAARPPLGGGCRRSRLGERKYRVISLPPSALRAATSLSEGGFGVRIPTPVCGLARNDRERDVGSAVPYSAKRCHCEPVTVSLVWQSASQRGSAALQGPLWEGAVGAADWGRDSAYPAAGHMGPALQSTAGMLTERHPLRNDRRACPYNGRR